MRGTIRHGRSLVAAVLALPLVLAACGGGGSTGAVTTQLPSVATSAARPTSLAPTTPLPTSLATAAAWVDIGTQAKLKPNEPAPRQFTDPSADRVKQISNLIGGLDFKGLAIQTFFRAKADPTHPTYGNYIVKVVVFGSAAEAQSFRDADAKDVIDTKYSPQSGVGPFKKVATYADGVVLDDKKGHINLMFTIGNVAVDIRLGVAENAPGDGVKEIKKLGDDVVANSTKG